MGGVEGNVAWYSQRQVRQSMLVDVGKLVEYPYKVMRRSDFVPSMVRLQAFDYCLRFWLDPRDPAGPGITVVPVGAFKEDRELYHPGDMLGKGAALPRLGEFIGEVV